MFKLKNHLDVSGVVCESGSDIAETAMQCETKEACGTILTFRNDTKT